MIHQLKKQNPVSTLEENKGSELAGSPTKFQRTNRRGLKSPEETNVTSEQSSVITQPSFQTARKVQQPQERPAVISRTNGPNRQAVKSPMPEKSFPIKTKKVQTEPSPVAQSIVKPRTFERKRQEVNSDKKEEKNTIPDRKETIKTERPLEKQKMLNSRVKIQQQLQEEGPKLKRSSACGYIINRLFKKKVQSCFEQLKQNKISNRRKMVSESLCLIHSSCDFARRYQLRCYQIAFQRFKLMSKKVLKEQFGGEIKCFQSNIKKGKDNLTNILHSIQRQKLKQSFHLLFQRQRNLNNAKMALSLLSGYENKRIKEYFRTVRDNTERQGSVKIYLLSQLMSPHNFCIKQQLTLGLRKIQAYAAKNVSIVEQRPNITIPKNVQGHPAKYIDHPPSSPSPSAQEIQLSAKVDKLTSEIDKMSKEISSKQANQQNKKQHEGEMRKVKKAAEELKNQKKTLERQLKEKKNMNDSLKKKAGGKQKSFSSEDIMVDDTNKKGQTDFALLQQVYSEFYKTSDEEGSFNLRKVLKDRQIDISARSNTIQQWNLILKKAKLQTSIERYQSSILGSKNTDTNSVVKMVRQENELVRNMIRNYIKERYLWGQVQKFIASVM